MKKHILAEKIEELVLPLIAVQELELWGVEITAEGNNSVVRVYLDTPVQDEKSGTDETEQTSAEILDAVETEEPVADASKAKGKGKGKGKAKTKAEAETQAQGGVTISQCTRISRQLALALDVDDFIPGSYALQVSSPGFERPFFEISQMAPYVGREVSVNSEIPIGGAFEERRKFKGTLKQVDEDRIIVTVGENDAELYWDNVKKAKLIHIFEDNSPKPLNKRTKKKRKK